jgi:hypothetical protein
MIALGLALGGLQAGLGLLSNLRGYRAQKRQVKDQARMAEQQRSNILSSFIQNTSLLNQRQKERKDSEAFQRDQNNIANLQARGVLDLQRTNSDFQGNTANIVYDDFLGQVDKQRMLLDRQAQLNDNADVAAQRQLADQADNARRATVQPMEAADGFTSFIGAGLGAYQNFAAGSAYGSQIQSTRDQQGLLNRVQGVTPVSPLQRGLNTLQGFKSSLQARANTPPVPNSPFTNDVKGFLRRFTR